MLALLSVSGCVLSASPTVSLRNGVSMPLVACGTGGESDQAGEQLVEAALVKTTHLHDRLHGHHTVCDHDPHTCGRGWVHKPSG